MQLIETLLEDFYTILEETKNSVSRDSVFPAVDKMIKVAIGVRRSGKTYFLYQHIHHLLQQNVPCEAILYINFEDNRLLPMDHKVMGKLLDSFYSLYPENHKRQCYLFLDGIQSVKGWELVVRRFFDTKKSQIYLTGSSLKLFGKEIAAPLSGRSLPIEIWPYNFGEYLSVHTIKTLKKPVKEAAIDVLNKHFLDFLSIGGFPAVQELPENLHRETLQHYVETVIFRDVVERHGVTNVALLKYLVSTLLKNFASLFSGNKFYNDIKSQGYQIGKDTIYNYMDYLEDAYLIATVPLFTESFRQSQITPKKVYVVDNGLIQANILSETKNYGRLLENQVYLDFRRQNKKIFYYKTKSGYEIDFVTQALDGKKEIIQVVWDLSNSETRLREERALKEAEQELGIKGRLIDKAAYLADFLSR